MDIEYIGVMIPILGICLGAFAIWANHKQSIAKIEGKAMAQNTAEKAAQYASNMKALEDRVQVLERIVTDRGYDVATQIEALRDVKAIEDTSTGIPLNIENKEKA